MNLLETTRNLEGWCSDEKKSFLYNLIREKEPSIVVELGVYGGSSFIPMVLGNTSTSVFYGVDPWKTADALQGYTHDNEHYKWWNEVDIEKIYRGFCKSLQDIQHPLNTKVQILRKTSLEAINNFQDDSIEVLHQDGNHSSEVCVEETKRYIPKMTSTSWWVMDDTDWESTKPAQDVLLQHGYSVVHDQGNYKCFYRKTPLVIPV